MALKDLAALLDLTEAEAKKRLDAAVAAGPFKGGLDGDEVASLAEVFGLDLPVPPDGHVNNGKVTSGLAKLSPPPKTETPQPRRTTRKGGHRGQ